MAEDEELHSSLQSKLASFGDSSFTWGAVGMLVGCIESPHAHGLLFLSWLALSVAAWRANVFESPNRKLRLGGNVFLTVVLALVVVGLGHVIPKAPIPQPPAPSLGEIGDLFDQRLNSHDAQGLKQTELAKPASASDIAEYFVKKVASTQTGPISDDRLRLFADDVIQRFKEARKEFDRGYQELGTPRKEDNAERSAKYVQWLKDFDDHHAVLFADADWICAHLRQRLGETIPEGKLIDTSRISGVQLDGGMYALQQLVEKLPNDQSPARKK